MSLVKFAVDFDTHRILVSERQNSDRGVAQPLAWKNYAQVEVWPVRQSATGGLREQLESIDVTDRTLHIYIGTLTGTLYASLIDFTLDEVNNRFLGVISLNSAALTSAFGGTTTQLDAYIEFRLIGDGEPRSVIKPIKILRPVWTGATEPDVEDQTPEWLTENLSLMFDDSDTIDVQVSGNAFTWHVRRKTAGRIGADSNGIYVEEFVAAPGDLVAQLRLESPFLEGGTVTQAENSTDEVAVVAGGTAGNYYQTRLRVRGRSELRSYSGGSAIGRFYTGASTPSAPRNEWKLEISSPAQVYWLNYDASNDGVALLDYLTPLLTIEGGATVTLSYDTKDGEQLSVDGLPVGVEEPAGTAVPFIQIDQMDAIPGLEVSGDETTYEAITITDASTSPTNQEIALPHRIKSLVVTVENEPYAEAWTHNLVLKLEQDLHDGDLFLISLLMPASVLPTINIRNNSVGGTILAAITGDEVAVTYELKCVFNGTAWELRGIYQVGTAGEESNVIDQGVAASSTVDMDGPRYQTLDKAVAFTLATSNRAPAGKVKEAAVLITNTDASAIAVTYAAGIKKPASAVTTIAAGASVWFSLTSMGPTEAETHCASLAVS